MLHYGKGRDAREYQGTTVHMHGHPNAVVAFVKIAHVLH